MCTYIDKIYYIFIYTKEARRSFGLEGSPAGLMSSSSFSLPPSFVIGPAVPPLNYGVSSGRTLEMVADTCLLCLPHLVY